MKIQLIIVGLLSFVICFGKTPKQKSLLIAEYGINNKGRGDSTFLVSYNFIDGKLSSKDTILSTPTSKGQNQVAYFSYNLGQNLIYKNRYVITSVGNVIDITTKSLVMEESDELIETRNDSIIFHRNNLNSGTGYLICNLKNRTYEFVTDKNFLNVKGVNSPNHLWGLEVDQYELPYKIILFNKENEKEVIVKDCGWGDLLSPFASTMPVVPILWVDNQNFLYALYGFDNNKKKETATVRVFKVNIETKGSEIIAKIDSVPPATSNSRFLKNPEGKIIFDCSKGEHLIELNKKQATPYKMSSVGNGFSIENIDNERYGSIISYKDKEIGRVRCNQYNAKTISEFIGVEYYDIGSNPGYPRGIKVWNEKTEIWTDIEIPWVSSIIGWIEK